MLYELLSGVRPYQLKNAASIGMLEQAIFTVGVTRPSRRLEAERAVAWSTTPERLVRQLRGDLDAITLKALTKERAGRYPTAAALAEDLRRHLQGRPWREPSHQDVRLPFPNNKKSQSPTSPMSGIAFGRCLND